MIIGNQTKNRSRVTQGGVFTAELFSGRRIVVEKIRRRFSCGIGEERSEDLILLVVCSEPTNVLTLLYAYDGGERTMQGISNEV